MRTLVCLAAIVLAGCATTTKDFNRMRINMDKAGVVGLLGAPASTSAEGDNETLVYRLSESQVASWPQEYIVELKRDRVTRFGRADLLGYKSERHGTSCVTVPMGSGMVTKCQ